MSTRIPRPADRPMATAPPTSAPASAKPLDFYQDLARQADDDSRGLKTSLIVAAVLHGILLLITFPNLYSQPLIEDAPERKVIKLSKTPIFVPPEPQPIEIPKPLARKVPFPDPTPDDPEPLRVETPEVKIEMPDLEGLQLVIPDRPPEPEPTGPITIHGGVERPQRVHYVAPEYTETARRIRLEGPVILQTIIDVDGNVLEVKVLKGMSFGLTESAVAAVQQWRFEPATLNGQPVAVYYNLTVNFALK